MQDLYPGLRDRISQDLCAANERKPTERDLHNKGNLLAHITEVEVTTDR